jgi:4'-phosphopantetheinyl transferase
MNWLLLTVEQDWNRQMTNVVVHASAVDDAILSRHSCVLNSEEVAQASRFVRTEDRRLFSYGRIQRRLVLASYLGMAPERLHFAETALGKPILATPAAPRITFNTSQAGGWAAVAVVPSGEAEVGVDIECANRQVTEALVRACLSSREQMWLRALPEPQQHTSFMRLWTCKEAILKSSGHGLRIDPVTIEIDPQAFTPCALPGELAPAHNYRLSSSAIDRMGWIATCLLHPADGRIDVTYVI